MVKYFVKCINQHGVAHLTLGKEYEQRFFKQDSDSGTITVTNDDGSEFTYPSCLFGVSYVETASHKHSNPIHAWANGAIIQYRFDNAQDWLACEDNHPKWLRHYEYRVKPAIDVEAIKEAKADVTMYEKSVSKHRKVITLHNRYLFTDMEKLTAAHSHLKSLESGDKPDD